MTTPPDRVGLCQRCVHARIVPTPRSTFWRCMLAETDARFERYPRLPVLSCVGFTTAKAEKADGPDEESPGP